jgi:hypothetical protein
MIRESGNGGLWAVTEVALMPWTAKRSITSASTVRHGGLSTSTMESFGRVDQNVGRNRATTGGFSISKPSNFAAPVHGIVR